MKLKKPAWVYIWPIVIIILIIIFLYMIYTGQR